MALLEHGRVNPVANVVDNEFGKRYSVDGEIRSPDGRNPTIRTVWIVEAGLDIPHMGYFLTTSLENAVPEKSYVRLPNATIPVF